MYCGGDDIGAIVADVGSSTSRIGYAGDDCPRALFSSSVGVTAGEGGQPNYHFDIHNFKENMSMESAVVDGIVENWDALEKIWSYAVTNFLKLDTAEAPVLFAEKSYNTPTARQRVCELMFETFRSPALFVSKDAVLQCYSCGRTSGLVIDVGSSGTVVTPVLDGWVESKGICRNAVGGRYMDAHLLNLLRKRQTTFGLSNRLVPQFRLSKTIFQEQVTACVLAERRNVHPSYEAFMNLELSRDVKESVCRMAEAAVSELDPRYANLPSLPYELPDGTIIDVGIERFLTSEPLCEVSPPDLSRQVELNALGLLSTSAATSCPLAPIAKAVPRLVIDSVMKCDTETHANLLSNLVVAGGGSSLEGIPERLRWEVEQIVHASAPTWKVKMVAAANSERALSTWLGGSILASLGSFHEMWMTKAEYDEYGPNLIDKKCP